MKKLLVIAALLLLGGCKTTCNDWTVFSANGCKKECHRTHDPLRCECNHKEKCCGAATSNH